MNRERIPSRLYLMGCCGLLLCWPNHRHPSYCPGCGKHVFPDVKGWARVSDPNAELRYTIDETTTL